ncbi:MAG: 5-bromo-4-chloroindolyl phosphate hydrolysis family protein [Candidatus Ventricola sp.]
MKAKKLLKKLNYLPRWAWYAVSFFAAGGPFGCLAVYLAFHVLEKMAAEEDEEDAQTYAAGRIYRDAECTVSSDEDIERRWREAEASADHAQARQTGRQETPIGENAELDEVVRAGNDALRRIRHANDIIADPELSRQIDSIENSCRQILSILEQRPQLLGQLRTFLRYYLPTTLKLLDARARLENTANTPKAREVRARISEAVGVIDKAFLKQVEALDAYRFIDLESEMDVLRDMLKADGLIDETKDTKEDDPFASVLGGH